MKKTVLLSLSALLLNIGSAFAQSQWANRVLEFLPAPGQFTNEKAYPAYTPGDDGMVMAQKATAIIQSNASAGTGNNMSTISLGAYGGYIIAGFDHSVLNKPYSYDLKIHGNWFDGNAESGIVMVSKDDNRNGLADDAWYELAGSQYYDPSTVHFYEMTYERPAPLDGNVKWTDNLGRSGYVLRNSYHLQESYYPLWYQGEKLVFKGSKLISNAWNTALPPQQYWRSESFAYGYADNQGNGSELSNFDIDWAVDAKGNKVKLDHIDFVKVYTALIQDAGWLGETSTEFSQAQDLHPEYAFPPVFLSDIHTVKKLPALSANTAWIGTANTSFTDDTVTFNGLFENAVLKDGFTYTNQTSGAYASAAGKGATGSSYISGIYDANAGNNNRFIHFNDGLPHGIEGVYVNNAAASLALLKQSMQPGDYVNLVVSGFDAAGNATGTQATFPLASYETLNSVMYYVVEDWCWMDLRALGSVSSLAISLKASRPEITPAAFCLDQLTIDILSITQQPQGNPNGSPKLCEGIPYALKAAAVGAGITYQWYKDDVVLTGATSGTFNFTSIKATDSGQYYCIVSNGKNKSRTDVAPLVVYKNTKITQNQPGGIINVPQVEQVTASIKVEGDKLVYQWYKGNLNFPNNPYALVAIALNSTSKSPDFVPAPYGFITDYEGYYYCQVTGVCGTVRTDTTGYKVVPNPNLPELLITKQPKDTTVCFGSTIVLSVDAPAATGYAWMKQNTLGTFSALGASLKQQITIANLISNGSYRCTVKQDIKTKYTDTIQVTVVQKLAIVQPAAIAHLGSYTALQHKPLTMAVSALDFTPTAYQWYYKSASDVDFQILSGANTAVFSIDYPLPADGGKYRCVVTGAAGNSQIEYNLSVVSSIAEQPTLYYYQDPSGMDGDVREGGLFEVGEHVRLTAYAIDGFTYKWYKDGVEITVADENSNLTDDGTVTAGYWTTADYPSYLMIKDVQKVQAGTYVFETINEDGFVEERSDSILIIIDPLKPEITNVLQSLVANEDDTLKFLIKADGKGFAPAYQWYRNGVALMGATKSPYVTNSPAMAAFHVIAKPESAGTYFCIVTTPGGSDTSNVVTVTIHPKVRIITHPADLLVQAGKTANFTILAEGTNLTYQWKRAGSPISGANAASLSIANASLSDEALYTCVVTAPGLVDAESAPAALAVINRPEISGDTACFGTTKINVQPQIKSVQVRYQWFKDKQPLTGATYSWLQLNQTTSDHSQYYCIVTNSAGLSSDTVVLIATQPQITTQPAADVTVEEKQNVTLSLTATGQGLHYQWYHNTVLLTGEINAVLSFTATTEKDGDYNCKVVNACGETWSETSTLKTSVITSVNDDLLSGQLVVYPNPAETYITVKASAGDIAKIFDLTGRLLYTQTLNTDTAVLPVYGLESGLYILHVKGTTDKTIRLIKR